jgi:outer membrane protein OmpA-like peptidoglycan-associated protein
MLAGCNSLPTHNSLLDEARNDYRNAQANPQVASLAAGELSQAGDSLDRANGAWSKDEDKALVDHLAYVAKQQVAIARETADQKAAERAVADAAAERDAVRLEARTREADLAQRNARESQRESQAAQRRAQDSQLQSEAAQRSAEASQRRAESERLAANAAQIDAQVARQQTDAVQARTAQLEAQLKEMDAKKTDRGMVVTLGDVLFDTDRAELKSGGIRNVQKLADFFRQYPQRNVMIEGFTDSTGSDIHNQRLSDRRADTVRTALIGMGMDSERITWRGYGESFPVAGNETAAGRQLNRRVEVVVSDEYGKIAPR